MTLKRLSLMALLSLSSIAANAIQFESTNPAQPIVVRITYDISINSNNSNIRRLFNAQERRRFEVIESLQADGRVYSYQYFNSAGVMVSRQAMTQDEFRTMKVFLDTLGKCAIDISLDRNTGKIQKVKSLCDVMSNVESDSDVG